MPNISGFTLAQLRAATLPQILTALGNYINANYTKAQFVDWLIDNTQINLVTKVPRPTVITTASDGQIASQTDINEDTNTAVQVDGRKITWTYYLTHEVDTITIQMLDASNNVTATKTIKHYLDERQPTVTLA